MKLVGEQIFKCGDIDLALVDSSNNRYGAIRTKQTYPFWMTTEGYVYYEVGGKLVGRWSLKNNPFSDDDPIEAFLCSMSLSEASKPITEDYFNTLLRRSDLIKHISGRYVIYENPELAHQYFSLSFNSKIQIKPITRRKTKNIKIGTRKNNPITNH